MLAADTEFLPCAHSSIFMFNKTWCTWYESLCSSYMQPKMMFFVMRALPLFQRLVSKSSFEGFHNGGSDDD